MISAKALPGGLFLCRGSASRTTAPQSLRDSEKRQLDGHAFNAIPQELRVEIHQQSHSQTSHFEVSEQLSLMDTEQFFNRLDLYDHLLLNDQVRAVTSRQLNTLVNNRNLSLAVDSASARAEFETQAFFVG